MDKIVVATESSVLPNPENVLESVLVTEQEVVVVTTDTTGVVVTGIMGPPGESGKISEASDIDKTNLVNGATLVYASNTAKWVATTLLENQILEAGQF
jgi:hypothetical protein